MAETLQEIESAIAQSIKAGFDKLLPAEFAKLVEKRDNLKLGLSTGATNLALHKEAELVLRSLPNPDVARTVKCPGCHEDFQTNYLYQRYCSFGCLRAALADRGIEWNPDKPASERWQGEPPAVIKPETLKSLRKWAMAILNHPATNEQLTVTVPEPSNVVISTVSTPIKSELDLDFSF